MRYLITGLNGTVAPAIAQALTARGAKVIRWDRIEVPTNDPYAVEQFIRTQQPDWFFHVATGSPDWAESIAVACARFQVPLLFTSSVSVFGPHQTAPLTPATLPQAEDDYGRYKRECEDRMRAAYPQLVIARLAWQIGDAPGSNTMTDYLARQAAQGLIAASEQWYPACAFLEDTATTILELADAARPGIYHLDANPGWSFYTIAHKLQQKLATDWQIVPVQEPVFDNRMVDQNISMRSISTHF